MSKEQFKSKDHLWPEATSGLGLLAFLTGNPIAGILLVAGGVWWRRKRTRALENELTKQK
jgi:hypothetical protein